MIYYVDIDGTICNNTNGKYADAVPIYERIEKINSLYDEGNTIVYWTARGSVTGIDWTELTRAQLSEWNAKHHDVKLGKPHYDLFICDKAIESETFLMKKLKVNYYDSLMTKENNFEQHQAWTMSRAWNPKKLEWIYGGGCMPEAAEPIRRLPEDGVDVSLFTDKDVHSPMVDEVNTKYKVVYLSECRSIHPFAYHNIVQVEDKFDHIFTHDSELLKRGPKYVKNVLGTSWLTDEEAKIYPKTKLTSHIASSKKWSRGHNLRHLIGNAINGKFDVDFWGSAYTPFDSKLTPLKDYKFSITVMNAKHDNYFTETLVDTFRCGTIPIFWGCENIGEFFNEKGILRFDTGPELFKILNNISEDLYNEMLPYAEENFELAKKYVCVDDVIAQNIIDTLGLEGYE